MTADNIYPEANSFNTRRFGNFNINKAVQGGYISYTGKNAKYLQVPNQDQPMYGTPEYDKKYAKLRELTVPDTAPDTSLNGSIMSSGFIPGRPDLFIMHDGSIISFKTGKIIKKSLNKSNIIQNIPGQSEWDNTPSIEQLMQNMNNNQQFDYDPNIDAYSRQYWQKAVEETKKLESTLTQEQKDSLKAFEAHFPKTKFINEI